MLCKKNIGAEFFLALFRIYIKKIWSIIKLPVLDSLKKTERITLADSKDLL